VIRFASIDYVGSVIGQAYGSLLPLLVLSTLGAAANGSFYIAWTISTGLELVAMNFATSLLVEGAAAPHRLGELTRGIFTRCLLVTVSGAAVIGGMAHFILSIYGHGYAANASLVLTLLSVGAVLYGLLSIAFSLDRLAGRVGRATFTRLVLAVLVLGTSWLLLRRMGINGVRVA
jgi:O-antigen/teichoic acid export membrane protein